MPNAVFIPAELNDLSVDVALGTPAQGAVLYRGAAKWNALAAGGAGQVLTSGGINANPVWAPVSPDLSAAVILSPAASARNVIAPSVDGVIGLTVHGRPDVTSLVIDKSAPATSLGYHLEIKDSSGNTFFSVAESSVDNCFTVSPPDDNVPFRLKLPASAVNSPIFWSSVGDRRMFRVENDCSLGFLPETSGGFAVYAGFIAPSFADNNAAHVRGRLTFTVTDGNFAANTREALRLESSGSAAAIGFLGASAAMRQTLPAAATDPATTQALANALRSLAITFGLAN